MPPTIPLAVLSAPHRLPRRHFQYHRGRDRNLLIISEEAHLC